MNSYDIQITNHAGNILHVYVESSTNMGAIQDALAQVREWGNSGAIVQVHVEMLGD